MDANLELNQQTIEQDAPDTYDVIVIGGGPAGSSAAIYAARAKLKTLVIDKGLTTGALGITGKIANYPGITELASGADLLERIRDQAISAGAAFVTDKVIGVDFNEKEKTVFCNNGTYTANSVIIASGSMGRISQIPGEDRLIGRGVSYCATCDGAFFRDREVAVAGNTDEAIEEALFLTRFAAKVHFFSPTPELKAPQHLSDELTHHLKVILHTSTTIREIIGQEQVEAIRFSKRGTQGETIPVSGAFIYLQGGKPMTDFIQGHIPLNESGCIEVKGDYQTGIPGTFAAGDVICNHVKQVVVSAGEGAQAGMAVEKYLRGRKHIVVDWHKSKN